MQFHAAATDPVCDAPTVRVLRPIVAELADQIAWGEAVIQALCAERGLWLLEDCAQAHGAEWQGRKVGGFGRAAAFSFYPSKNLSVMGDGGLLVTNDDAVAARCRQLRDHGRLNKDVHAEVGFNLRFNDIQAAVGRVLLRRLDAMNEQRRRVAARYARGLAGLPLSLPSERAGARHVYHLYVIRTDRRDALAKYLRERGIAIVDSHERADLVLVNTCTVTSEADAKSRHAVRRARRTSPDAEIVVTGRPMKSRSFEGSQSQ